jgi:outer membrane receptor for ferrienterochelin and colicins
MNARTEIVVTAARRAMPLADTPEVIQLVDRHAIAEIKPTRTGEIFDYLTGASVETGTGVGMPNRSVVSINGLPANYTLVLVDGVRLLSEHIHTGQNIENVPAQAIERIEVMRGAASAQYGTGPIGGLVNVLTRRCGDVPELTLEVAGSRYNTWESGASLLLPLSDELRLSSFARREESDGVPLLAPASRAGHTAYSRLHLLNRVDLDLGDETKAFASLGYVANTMDFNLGNATAPRWGEADMTLITPVVGFTQRLTPLLDIAGQAAYSDWDNEASAEKNIFWEPELHATWRAAEGHTLLAGGDFRRNEFERSKVANHDQQSHGFFLQHDWKPLASFASTLSLRHDKVEDVEAAVSPKLAMMYTPVETLTVRASVGRGFHAPSLMELHEEGFGHSGTAYRFGNPDLEPEYSTTYTVGIDYRPLAPLNVVLHGFYSTIDDMIVPVFEGAWDQNPAVDVWRRTNIEEAEVYGGEAMLRWELTDAMRLEAGYTYADNEDKSTGRQLPYRPGSAVYGRLSASKALGSEMSLGVFVGVRAAFDREAWNWKPAAGTDPRNPDGLVTQLDDYAKLDAGASLTVGQDWELYVKVENILGEDIENLDDAYTIIDGEAICWLGVKYNVPLGL